MSDPVTALGGTRFDGLVALAEAEPRGMISLRGDIKDKRIVKSVKALTGMDMPAPLTGAISDGRGAFWMSPDEVLLFGPRATVAADHAALCAPLRTVHHLAADVSDARAVFTLDGDATREVLAKLTPIDMHPDSLKPGAVRRTRLAQSAGAIWMASDSRAEVLCFRSVARYVFGLLENAASPDARVEYF